MNDSRDERVPLERLLASHSRHAPRSAKRGQLLEVAFEIVGNMATTQHRPLLQGVRSVSVEYWTVPDEAQLVHTDF
ncbi:MAG: hypothetical protein ACM3Q9_02220 [Methanosarcina sp.]